MGPLESAFGVAFEDVRQLRFGMRRHHLRQRARLSQFSAVDIDSDVNKLVQIVGDYHVFRVDRLQTNLSIVNRGRPDYDIT